jgi:hypothetical protein
MTVSKSFDDHLAVVRGKIHRVSMASDFERFRDGLLYYWNRAEALKNGADIISKANGPPAAFALLAGLSIEVVLKGIHRAFDMTIPQHHRLIDLCASVGIKIDADDKIGLKALSEHVYWASRYPVPRSEKDLIAAQESFDQQRRKSGNASNYYIKEREISYENYARLWGMFADFY